MKFTEKEERDMQLVELAIKAAGGGKKLAKIIGMSPGTISRMRNGKFRNTKGEGLSRSTEMCFINAEKISRLLQENAMLKRGKRI